MATISTPGVGSGLDVKSIVSQLVALEKQPLTQLQTKATSLQTKLSAYGRIKSEMATLQDAASALLNKSTWDSKTFASTNVAAVSGTAQSGALAASFAVEVTQLAQAQSVRSAPVTSNTALGSDGRLDISTGAWSGNTFTAGSGGVVSVSVAATDTLSDIAAKINASGGGVTAMVVRSGTEDRLLMRGNTTGSASGFQVQTFTAGGAAITDGTTGVGKLAYASSPTAFYGMAQTQAAVNASLTIEGITVTSATNTVSDAVPGVTLNLNAVTTTAAQVTVGADKAESKAKIEAFRTAFNALNATLSDLTRYKGPGSKAAALQGDSTAVGLQNVLRAMVGAEGPPGTTAKRFSDIGLELQRDGSLNVNTAKFDASMADLPSLKTFFEADSGNALTDGMARRIRDFSRTANGIDGNVDGRNKELTRAVQANANEQERVTARVARTEVRLYAQFSRLDANMASLSSLGSFVSQQVTMWNKSS
jgi:flagellar hook-associated protein 2